MEVRSGSTARQFKVTATVTWVALARTTGGERSATVTVAVQLAALLEESRAVKVTLAAPNPSSVPGGGLWVTLTAPEASAATEMIVVAVASTFKTTSAGNWVRCSPPPSTGASSSPGKECSCGTSSR